jgi:hypothetical protein
MSALPPKAEVEKLGADVRYCEEARLAVPNPVLPLAGLMAACKTPSRILNIWAPRKMMRLT